MTFRSGEYLTAHIRSVLDFCDANIVDPSSGFFQNFRDDGSIVDEDSRHLVSSTRMVVNYCRAYELFGEEEFRCRALHGLHFVSRNHWDDARRGYNWTVTAEGPTDQTNHCYGLAFVLLMHSALHAARIVDNCVVIDETFEIPESRFWLGNDRLDADEANADWSKLSGYRGQNANMHTLEALLAPFEATSNQRYLECAYALAHKFTVELAGKSDDLIWEHFTSDLAWDEEYGGIQYGFDPQGAICDEQKYFWVQAESFAAAARLAIATGDETYWNWYDRIWSYANQYMIDKRYGA